MTDKKDIIKRWIQKAESDLKTARILMESKGSPTESICFHSQQAVEKLLKAYLTFANIRVGKTHDIATLLELCIEKDEDFKKLDLEKLEELTFYAVDVRYPDTFYIPSREEAKEALSLAETLRDFILKKLERILE
ncbi:HEPN domain-containing protein [Thermotoga sp.]|uniref:HEPN domain-containing protein n=1 Tax=Thermotoga sp. TaxID=28240 RepID=UPI0025E5AC58|nr:HEPN domain-containing protein [Thermotoga sp.]MCD6551379.1 HEPN domain-containing protein [Thermotoga sp.]